MVASSHSTCWYPLLRVIHVHVHAPCIHLPVFTPFPSSSHSTQSLSLLHLTSFCTLFLPTITSPLYLADLLLIYLPLSHSPLPPHYFSVLVQLLVKQAVARGETSDHSLSIISHDRGSARLATHGTPLRSDRGTTL